MKFFSSNKIPGIIAMIGSPFLFLEMTVSNLPAFQNSPAAGIMDMVYMTGWICSVIVLMRINATGDSKAAKFILQLQLVCLGIASTWNIWSAVNPASQHILFRVADMFWPISNIMLLVAGIMVLYNKKISGHLRYAVLIAGFWLPFAFAFGWLAGAKNEASFYAIGLYSVVAWFQLGMAVYNTPIKITPTASS